MPVGGLITTGLVLGGAQAVLGGIQTISGNAAKKKALAQRKPYQTPQEIYDILNLTESNAQQGYDPTTLAYLTNQTDRAFSGALGTAKLLGANPNDLSGVFDQKIQGLMKIGSENHQLNMENFSKYLGALDSVASNKAAEQKSQQDIVKDYLQSAGQEVQTGTANISGGINTAFSSLTAGKTSNLYKENLALKTLLQNNTMSGSQAPQYKNAFANNQVQTADGVLPNVVTNLNSNLYTSPFGG